MQPLWIYKWGVELSIFTKHPLISCCVLHDSQDVGREHQPASKQPFSMRGFLSPGRLASGSFWRDSGPRWSTLLQSIHTISKLLIITKIRSTIKRKQPLLALLEQKHSLQRRCANTIFSSYLFNDRPQFTLRPAFFWARSCLRTSKYCALMRLVPKSYPICHPREINRFNSSVI